MLHQITAKASLFTGAQASKKLKKRLFRELVDISESNVLNISMSIRPFLSFLHAGAPVNKEALAAFGQLLYISAKSIFSIYR